METWNILTITDIFHNQKRVNACEHTVKMAKVPPEGCERGGNCGKIKWKLSEVNTRAVSRGQNELIGNFPSIPSSLATPWWHLWKSSCDAIYTMCSDKFTLFWLRKTSEIIEMFQISCRVFVCAFPPEISSLFGKSFPFPFPYFFYSLLIDEDLCERQNI